MIVPVELNPEEIELDTSIDLNDSSNEDGYQPDDSSSEDEAGYFLDISPQKKQLDRSIEGDKRRLSRYKNLCKKFNNIIKISTRSDCICCSVCNRSFKDGPNLCQNIKRHLNNNPNSRHNKRLTELKREAEIDASIIDDPYLTDEKDTPNAKKRLPPHPRSVGIAASYKAAKIVLKHRAPVEALRKGNKLEYEIMTKLGRTISSETVRRVGLPYLVKSKIFHA